MTAEETVCKWIDKKIKDGDAVTFSLDCGTVGVWIGEHAKDEPATGYGDSIIDAVLEAIGWEEMDRLLTNGWVCDKCSYDRPQSGTMCGKCGKERE